jgi:hypothetical protein
VQDLLTHFRCKKSRSSAAGQKSHNQDFYQLFQILILIYVALQAVPAGLYHLSLNFVIAGILRKYTTAPVDSKVEISADPDRERPPLPVRRQQDWVRQEPVMLDLRTMHFKEQP